MSQQLRCEVTLIKHGDLQSDLSYFRKLDAALERTANPLARPNVAIQLDEGVLSIDPQTGLVSIAEEHRDDVLLKGLHGKVVHIANLEGPVQELPRFKMKEECPSGEQRQSHETSPMEPAANDGPEVEMGKQRMAG